MSTTKRTFANFSFFDKETIEKKLEQMAAQGWMLRKAGSLFWTYEKTEPQKLRFAIIYFPGVSALDPHPSQRQLDKEAFCVQDGWQLVLRWDAMAIFCTEREDAAPIDTDPVPYVETLYQTMKKKLLTGQLVTVALLLWALNLQLSQLWRDPTDYLSSMSSLFAIPFWLLLLCSEVVQVLVCFRWQRKAKKAAEQGVFLPMRSNKLFTWGVLFLAVLFLLLSTVGSNANLVVSLCFYGLMAVSAILAYRLVGWLKKKGVHRLINLLIATALTLLLVLVGTFGLVRAVGDSWFPVESGRQPVDTYEWNGERFDVYDDPLPLEVEDLVDVEARWSKEADWQESPLLARGEYCQSALFNEEVRQYCLSYTITDIKVPALYSFLQNRMLHGRQDEIHNGVVFVDHFEPVDPALWGAEAVYQLHWDDSILDTYLVCWDTRIVELKFYWEPTKEQIQTAAELLCP